MKKSKTLNFIKQNAVYLVIALCILAIGLSATLMLTNKSANKSANVEQPPVVTPGEPDEPETPDTPVTPDEPDEPEVPDEPTINPDTPSQPVVEPITFIMPVDNPTNVEYYSDTMVFNSTLNHYTAHLAIDFFAPEGTPVYAVCDGKVSAVEKTLLEGVTVTIDHGDGLFSVYNSLADPDSVTVGQQVKKGDIIGEVSTTNRQEHKSGAHLHFEVIENGEIIDPEKYLTFNNK